MIARALNVSPADLMFPLGQRETVELMPGYHLDTWKAVLWWSGFAARPGHPPPTLENSLVPLRQLHDRVLEDVAVASHEHRQTAATSLRQIRRDMRERGLVLPELPKYMAGYDVDNGEPVQ